MREIPMPPSGRWAGWLFRLFGGGLLALGAEFPAFLAVKSLGIGFLRAFERGGGARFLGLLFRRRLGIGLGLGLGRIGLGWRRGLFGRGAHQQKGNHGSRGGKGGDLRHGAPRIENKGATVAL